MLYRIVQNYSTDKLFINALYYVFLARFYQGNYTEAQRLMEDALFTCEELLGPLHPATAVTLNNLAGLLHSLTLYEKALPIYKRALKIKEKAFGADHPDVASTLNNIGMLSIVTVFHRSQTDRIFLGLLYKMQGQLDDAQAQYESALEMQKKLYGSVHADVAATMSNLASLYTAQGKFYDAKVTIHCILCCLCNAVYLGVTFSPGSNIF